MPCTKSLHPATPLAGFFFFAALLPALPALALAAALIVSVALAGRFAPASGLTLLRRSRFLILALAVLHAWFTPGEALWGGALAALSPTREGGALALEHCARLIALLMMLALLLEKLGLPDLVAGTMAMLSPLRLIGVAPDRAALRLALVLELLERRQRLAWREWIGLAEQGEGEARVVRLALPAWSGRDRLLIVSFALICALTWGLAR